MKKKQWQLGISNHSNEHVGLVVNMAKRLLIFLTKIKVERKLTATISTIQVLVDIDSLESTTTTAKSDIVSASAIQESRR